MLPKARFRQLRRWKLGPQGDQPAVGVGVDGGWYGTHGEMGLKWGRRAFQTSILPGGLIT